MERNKIVAQQVIDRLKIDAEAHAQHLWFVPALSTGDAMRVEQNARPLEKYNVCNSRGCAAGWACHYAGLLTASGQLDIVLLGRSGWTEAGAQAFGIDIQEPDGYRLADALFHGGNSTEAVIEGLERFIADESYIDIIDFLTEALDEADEDDTLA